MTFQDDGQNSKNDVSNFVNFHDMLENFRLKWQIEIRENKLDDSSDNKSKQLDSLENQARICFLKGVELERRGRVYDALSFYRRAIQITPDIESRIYNSENNQVENKDNFKKLPPVKTEKFEKINVASNLLNKFNNHFAENGVTINKRFSAKGVICTSTHISELPTEIILYIFRWVVSSQLDIFSLEQCAAVCKAFYIYARDEDIWFLICKKVWKENVSTPKQCGYQNWRQMYKERTRVNFNGCYISKTSYNRQGENCFQDQFYRPIHIIEYYRLFRFLPDGTVLFITSADDPSSSVQMLNNTSNIRPEILRGHYSLHDNNVVIFIKREIKATNSYNQKRRSDDINNKSEFYIKFKILNRNQKKFVQLQWKDYYMIQYNNGKEHSTTFELTKSKYPPLWFSIVKSYNKELKSSL